MAEITPINLASNPKNDTFGEFAFWLYAGESDDLDALKARAQWAMDRFQGYTIGLIEAMRQDSTWRQWLHKIRAGIVGRAPLKDSGNEDEVGSDEGGVMEESLETFDDTGFLSEARYSSNGEEDGSMNDDEEEEGMDENEATNPAAATVGGDEDLMDEKEDADTDAATVGKEEDFCSAPFDEVRASADPRFVIDRIPRLEILMAYNRGIAQPYITK